MKKKLMFLALLALLTLNQSPILSEGEQLTTEQIQPVIVSVVLPPISRGDIVRSQKVVEVKVEETTEVIEIKEPSINLTNQEKDLLSRLVRAEAQGECYEGKVSVAIVVLNRIDSNQFPNTLEGVVYQKNQFQPVSSGSIKRYADEDSIRAVEEALYSDRSELNGALFFYNPKIATSRWLDNKETVLIIGNHVFKK